MGELDKELMALQEQKNNETDFEKQMEIADKIHNIKMKINGTKPTDTYIDCVGCGS